MKHPIYTPICSLKEIGERWNPKAKVPSNNISANYAKNPDKQTQFEVLDLGTFCVGNRLDGKMLKFMVDYKEALLEAMFGMTIDEHEDFKRLQEFDKLRREKK